MPQERYAKWDTMKLPYGFNEAYLEPPATVEGERARRRVAPYEEYVSHLGDVGDDERAAMQRAALVRETKRRLAHWNRPGVAPSSLATTPSTISVTRVVAIAVVALIVWIALAYLPSVWIAGLPRWAPYAGIALFGATSILAILRVGRAQEQLLAGAGSGRCVDCGYDLRETRPAIVPNDLDGQWIGPRACPECGAPWPMLPPPVFDG